MREMVIGMFLESPLSRSDDGYEAFFSIPLLYCLGGASDLDPMGRKQWEAVTNQFTGYGEGETHCLSLRSPLATLTKTAAFAWCCCSSSQSMHQI